MLLWVAMGNDGIVQVAYMIFPPFIWSPSASILYVNDGTIFCDVSMTSILKKKKHDVNSEEKKSKIFYLKDHTFLMLKIYFDQFKQDFHTGLKFRYIGLHDDLQIKNS